MKVLDPDPPADLLKCTAYVPIYLSTAPLGGNSASAEPHDLQEAVGGDETTAGRGRCPARSSAAGTPRMDGAHRRALTPMLPCVTHCHCCFSVRIECLFEYQRPFWARNAAVLTRTAVRDLISISLVEHRGFEPRTPCLPGKCSPAELMPREVLSVTGGARGGQRGRGVRQSSGSISALRGRAGGWSRAGSAGLARCARARPA